MAQKIDVVPETELELAICRLIDAPVEKVFRAWTDGSTYPEWFCPKPWFVSKAEMDVRAGGSSLVVMKGPNGEEFPNRGVYLEVVPNQRLVFTDAFTSAWFPSAKAFMVGVITFEAEGNKTKYTARVRHWTKEDYEQHRQRGFEQGWGIMTDQLEAFVKKQ